MRLDSLNRRVGVLEAEAHRGWTPTTTSNGKRAWIKESGIRLWYELNKFSRDTGEPLKAETLPADFLAKVDLWSRAELDDNCGQLAIATKRWAREILYEA